MIEINKPGIELVLTSNGHYEWLPQSLYFTDTGLYVLRLRACEVGTDIPVTVSDGKKREQFVSHPFYIVRVNGFIFLQEMKFISIRFLRCMITSLMVF